MKYLCFSYSSLDEGNVYRLSIPPHKYTLEMMAHFSQGQQSTKVGQPRFVTAKQLKYCM